MDKGRHDGMTDALREGELVQFLDNKGRRYQATLQVGKEFHSHSGYIAHEDIIGLPDGSTVKTTRGQVLIVARPTLSEYILKMPRGAQVIYPKDIGPILMLADLGPGMQIFESGLGSGALSTAMLRVGVEILGYEIREDFLNRARTNVSTFLGNTALENYHVHLQDAYEGIDAEGLDRVVLDLPEPWRVVEHAQKALRPGGIFLAYTPGVVQMMNLREQLAKSRFFGAETLEVLNRGWYVEGQAVRPDHRMVAHTAFLTTARLRAD